MSHFLDYLKQKEKQPKFANDNIIIFQHIPKTAGKSVSQFLRKNIKPWYIVQWYRKQKSWEECLSELDVKGYRLIGGHLTLRDIKKFPFDEKQANLIAFVRNPIARLISHYFYDLSPANPSHKVNIEKYPSIEDYINSLPENYLLNHWLLDRPVKNFEEALNLINNNYSFIGLTEFSNFSIFLLSNMIGIPVSSLVLSNQNNFSDYNSLKEKIKRNKNVLNLIMDRFYLDIQIYSYILECYQHYIDKFAISLLDNY